MIELKRSLSPLTVWAIAFGCIIGGSAFFMPANTFLPTAGPLGTAIAMLAAACVMIVIAFNYHYMVNKIPEAGGEFSYAQAAFGRTHSFICAWFLGLSYISLVPLNATLMGVVGKSLLGDVFRFGYMYGIAGFDVFAGEILLSLGVIVLFAWFNIRGVKTAGWVQMTLALSLIGGVFIVAIAAIFSPAASFKSLSPAFAPTGSILAGVLAVMAVSPWAFVGFDTIPQAAEEFNFSHTKTRMIMILAILFGATVYIALNTVTAAVVPTCYSSWVEYVGNVKNLQGIASLPTFNAAKSVLGTGGLLFIGVAVSAAALAGVLGFLLAASRLLFSMSRAGVLPTWFGQLSQTHATPVNAVLFVVALSSFAPFFGRTVLVWVVDMSALGAAIGFAYTSAATCKIAWAERKFLMSGLGFLGTVFSLLFAFLLLVPIKGVSCSLTAEEYVALGIWVVLGIVFYKFSGGKRMLRTTIN